MFFFLCAFIEPVKKVKKRQKIELPEYSPETLANATAVAYMPIIDATQDEKVDQKLKVNIKARKLWTLVYFECMSMSIHHLNTVSILRAFVVVRIGNYDFYLRFQAINNLVASINLLSDIQLLAEIWSWIFSVQLSD